MHQPSMDLVIQYSAHSSVPQLLPLIHSVFMLMDPSLRSSVLRRLRQESVAQVLKTTDTVGPSARTARPVKIITDRVQTISKSSGHHGSYR